MPSAGFLSELSRCFLGSVLQLGSQMFPSQKHIRHLVLSFRMMVYSYLVTTDWIFDIISLLCESSINQLNGTHCWHYRAAWAFNFSVVILSMFESSITGYFLKRNPNASRPSEHPPVRGENVKTFRWDHRLQIQYYDLYKNVSQEHYFCLSKNMYEVTCVHSSL